MTLSANDFELLLQSNRILSSKLDIADVLNAVMELATKVVKAEAASLLLHDESTNELYFDVALGSAKDQVKRLRIKMGEGVAGWVAKERTPLIVNDVSKDPRFTGKVDKSTSFVTRSILAVPMIAKGRMIGVVEAINKELKGVFTESDKEAFEVFASQAAIAIENARLFSEMLHEKEKLNTVFAEMSDGVLLLDNKGHVVLMNQSAQRFLGVSLSDALGKRLFKELLKEFESQPSLEDLSKLQSKVTPVELIRRAGKDLFISALVVRMGKVEAASKEGFLVILHDTTEEKRGERLKRNFLSLISHKLKTPLTVIVGYGPALLSDTKNLSDFQKNAIKAMCEKGTQLGDLVNKLLRFTMVDSEPIRPNIEKKAVRPLVEEAVSSLADFIEETKSQVSLESSLSSIPEIKIDSGLVVEVFKNLIENGIKFNDKESKKVTVAAEKNNNGVTVFVSDNGVGIPSEEIEKVFQKFYQIENSFTGQVPGAGLGLALCKKIMESLGGRIDLTSQLKKGTSVRVFFPLNTTSSKT